MAIVLDGTSGITTNSGTLLSTNDATISGLTVGKGGGSEAGSTTVGGSSLGGASTNTGIDNSAFGFGTLYVNTSGSSNSAFGRGAMRYNTTGGSNSAFGYQALNNNTTASNNTAVGYQAGYTGSTNANGTFVGYQAGYATTGASNVCVGMQAGSNISTGAGNAIFGTTAGGQMTTGTHNTFIGSGIQGTNGGAGFYVTTGSKNTILGRYDGNSGGLDIRTASNYIVLSDGDGNPRIYVNSAGSMYAPGVYNTTAGVSSNLYVDSSGLFYRATSSLKYKTDVENATHGLADVLKLRPITYRGKAEVDVGKTYGGLLAEEVHDAGLTEFVQYADDGSPDALHYGNMVSLAFKAIQELKALVDAQATEIAELKAKVA